MSLPELMKPHAMMTEVKRVQELEREKFFVLFNIFVHEIKHINPELFPSCLEIEVMMNEAFGDKEKQNCI